MTDLKLIWVDETGRCTSCGKTGISVNVIDKQVCLQDGDDAKVDASRDASFHREGRSPTGEVRAGNGFEDSGRSGSQSELERSIA